ncbi:MAG: glycosyltransferase [Spirulina sp. SIO3F2]|nr:glycosyltransferase [Spirulina sp. SIO3F2]
MSDVAVTISAIALLYLLLSLPFVLILLTRLLQGAKRRAPIAPQTTAPEAAGSVTVVVPTLNEAQRVGPGLAGLQQQGSELHEVLVVDSRSQDGTADVVRAASAQDVRIQLLTDDPLPPGWVGRQWALDFGFRQSDPESEWILGIDADTRPAPGLIAGLLTVAIAENYDVVSLSPQFILEFPGEWWLQPALLMTLLYRFESSGVDATNPERVMANGQCFLCRRSVLVAMDGYTVAQGSFCDDVTLARAIAAQGYRVGFLDGQRVLQVRMYEGLRETWVEWGRSLDLKDAASQGQVWSDLWLLICTQGLPLWLVLLSGFCWQSEIQTLPIAVLGAVNGLLLLIRVALLGAIAPSYAGRKPIWFWLSPLADSLAVLRIWLSSSRQPTQWRGRQY